MFIFLCLHCVGEIRGTVHREVVKEFTSELQAGAAIVLRQVILCPFCHFIDTSKLQLSFLLQKAIFQNMNL